MNMPSSGGGITVGFESLDTAAANLKTGATNIDTTLSELESKLNVLRADWDGDAKGAYEVAQRDWNSALGAMKQLLESVGGTVTSSRDAYSGVEQKARNAWG